MRSRGALKINKPIGKKSKKTKTPRRKNVKARKKKPAAVSVKAKKAAILPKPAAAKRKKRKSAITLVRAEENPIISPKPENKWEAWQTFNPGVILLNDKVYLLYRAIGEDGISRLGHAVSFDGLAVDERLPYPVYEHEAGNRERVFNVYSYFSGGSFGGAEDPRIVQVDDEDTLSMTYTACDNGLRVALTSIKVKDFLDKKWRWKKPVLISPSGEIHKNWVIFPEKIKVPVVEVLANENRQLILQNNQSSRPSGIFGKALAWLLGRSLFSPLGRESFQPIDAKSQEGVGKYAILHSVSPKISIAYRDSLEFNEDECIQSHYDGNTRRKNCWDNWVRGVGAPPIKTKEGWLLFYHAMDKGDPGKYKVGVMLLDLKDPEKILHRAPEPILEPEEEYENNGFKGGVVYVCGAVVKDGELFVYYGASDNYVGVAHAPLEEFLAVLTKEAAPKLKIKILKKR